MGTEHVQTEIPMPKQPVRDFEPRVLQAVEHLRGLDYDIRVVGRDHLIGGRLVQGGKKLLGDKFVMLLAWSEGWRG